MRNIALLLVLCMVFSLGFAPAASAYFYYHDGGTYSFQNIDEYIHISDGTSLNVSGNISDGLTAYGMDTNATIIGNVYAEDRNALEAYNNATVSVGNDVSVGEGKTVTYIDSEGNEQSYYDYNVAIAAGGNSSVSVAGNVSVTSEDDFSLSAYDGSTIEVAGTVSGGEIHISDQGTNISVGAADVSEVRSYGDGESFKTIGDLTAEKISAFGDGSSIEVGGTLNAKEIDLLGDNEAISANNANITQFSSIGEKTKIDISGDLNGGSVYVGGENSVVTVGGGTITIAQISGANSSFTGIDSILSDAEVALRVNNGGYATVNGDVTVADSSTKKNGGFITPNTAVSVENNSFVLIGGDVSAGKNDYAIEAFKGGSVIVEGNVNGGSVDVSDSSININGSVNNGTVSASSEATVTIGGDVLGLEGKMRTYAIESGKERSYYSPVTVISAWRNSTVSVGGDVTTSENDMAISANNGSVVAISGEVNGGFIDVNGNNTKVTAGGGTISGAEVSGENASLTGITNIDATDRETSIFSSTALTVNNGGIVNIDGNVTGGPVRERTGLSGNPVYITSTAISASNNASVTVGGDVTTSENDMAISANNGSVVAIGGEVNGGFIDVNGNNTKVTAGGGTISGAEVSGENASLTGITNIDATDRDTGIFLNAALTVNNGGKVSIDGDVTGGSVRERTDLSGNPVYITSTAISASNNASVTVGGDVSVGEGYVEIVPMEHGFAQYNRTNTAINARNNTTITIGGNITVGADDTAIRAYYGSVVNVSGEINGGSIILSDTTSIPNPDGTLSMVTVSGEGSHVTAGGGTISSVNATGNGSTLSGITNVKADGKGAAIYAVGDVDISIDNDVSLNAIPVTVELPDGTSQTYNTSGPAIYAGEKATVNVGGNVTASGNAYNEAIYAYNEAVVTVNGNVDGDIYTTAFANHVMNEDGTVTEKELTSKGGTITVGGTVTSDGNAITANREATVKVGDDVTSGRVAISANNGSRVNVNGDVTAKQNGISTDNFSFVDVQGNVSTENIGIRVWLNSGEGKPGSIIVNGTVDAKNRAIDLPISGNANVEDILSVIPHIIVQTLKSDGDLVVVTAPGATAAEKKALQNALIDNIFYIVNTDSVDTTKIAIYGTEVVDGYVVATEDSVITLESKERGYVVCNVEAGRYATVIENPDGSVSITVERGGDLNISADVKKKENGRESYVRWDDYGSPWSDWIPSYSDLWTDPTPSYQDNWGLTGPTVQHTNYTPTTLWQPNYQNQGWDPAYVLSPDYSNMVLVLNLIGRQELCILHADLESFKTMGFETVNIVTESNSLYMSVSNLLECFENAAQCMFVNNRDTVELWVNGSLLMTLTLVTKQAA